MRLRFNELSDHLEGALSPVYLVCGDEPYQLGSAATLIRRHARSQGFDEREVLDQDGGFDWGALASAASAMSLFSAKKLIDLRITGTTPGRDGGAAIRDYCEHVCPDNLLLITAPTLDRKALDTQWAKAVDAIGVVIQVWPLKGPALTRWLAEHLARVGLRPNPGVAELIAERSEGNLLAAAQEVEKLGLLHEPGPLALEDLLGNLADSARFDLFALSDAALAGDRTRVDRVISVLRAEGTASALVLWVLAREIRMLAEAAGARARRAPLGPIYSAHRVPRMRQAGVERALQRLPVPLLHALLQSCARIDRAIKGLVPGDPWLGLQAVADRLAAGSTFRRR